MKNRGAETPKAERSDALPHLTEDELLDVFEPLDAEASEITPY
jgi:hypothetical protein